MSGYVASARIVSAPPRLARGRGLARGQGIPDTDRFAIVADEPPKPGLSSAIVIEAGPGASRPGPIVERLLAARERWSQLTFFLFDPNSWRT